MSDKNLPPLNALRVFEVAARLESFNAAAEELHVTPGAVSRHIALLEQALETELFLRRSRGVSLTINGRAYLHDIQPALRRIAVSTQRRRMQRGRFMVRVDTPASFAQRWLIPRLAQFHRERPDIEVHISSTYAQTDSAGQRYDMLLRLGPDPLDGYVGHAFLPNRRTVVCSPELAKSAGLTRVEALAEHTLLYAQTLTSAWSDWLAQAGQPTLLGRQAMYFDRIHLALAAAEAGIGLSLPSYALAEDALRQGRLVCPFPDIVTDIRPYTAYVPRARMESPGVAELYEWLQQAGSQSAVHGLSAPIAERDEKL